MGHRCSRDGKELPFAVSTRYVLEVGRESEEKVLWNSFFGELAHGWTPFEMLNRCAYVTVSTSKNSLVAQLIYPSLLYPSFGLAHTGRVGSVFLTLSVSVERYHSVCHPLR